MCVVFSSRETSEQLPVGMVTHLTGRLERIWCTLLPFPVSSWTVIVSTVSEVPASGEAPLFCMEEMLWGVHLPHPQDVLFLGTTDLSLQTI